MEVEVKSPQVSVEMFGVFFNDDDDIGPPVSPACVLLRVHLRSREKTPPLLPTTTDDDNERMNDNVGEAHGARRSCSAGATDRRSRRR